MSNKTILQNHNEIINNNNISIDDLIESINNLPEAGGEVVEPTLQEKTITPTTLSQIIEPDSSYDGLSKVTINGVTSAIDSDIKATNIRKGIDILGVTGTMEEYVAPKLQSKSATPKTTSQTITPDSSYDGLSSVSVGAVTSSIDSNITASNIKSGVSILGVEGTLEEGITPSGELTINDNGIYNVTNYASANVEIEKGITPTGTMSITSNGTYDVTNYASASVNVSSGGSGGFTKENVELTLKVTSSSSEHIPTIYYMHYDNNGEISEIYGHYRSIGTTNYNSTFEVMKGTTFYIVSPSFKTDIIIEDVTGNIVLPMGGVVGEEETIFSSSGIFAVQIDGTGTLSISCESPF